MTTKIIICDLTNKQYINAVIKLSIKNNFYIDQIWNTLLRKLSPSQINKLPTGFSRSDILNIEEQSLKFYDDYNWELRILMKDDIAIGFSIWDYPKDDGDGCCFEYLLIDEVERGNKYSKLLMDNFIVWSNINRPNTKVIFDDTILLNSFYTKYGFKDCGLIEQQYANCPLKVWYRIKN
jgi:hypothetical protein